MIQSVSIKNMKLFKEFNLNDLQRFSLFVGKNDCGKTTLLESVYLMIAPTNIILAGQIHNFRHIAFDKEYWAYYFHRLNPDEEIDIRANVKMDGAPVERRHLSISPSFKYTEIAESEDRSGGRETGSTRMTAELTGLKYHYGLKKNGTEEVTYDLELSRKGEIFEGTFVEGYTEPLVGAFHAPTTMYLDILARLNDLIIKKKTPDVIKVMKMIDPSIKGFHAGPNAAYCDIGLDSMVQLNLMGGGFIKTFGILLAILACKNGVVLVDEIENGLDFSSLRVMWRAIIDAAYSNNVQLFATTHSMECVAAYSEAVKERPQRKDDLRLYRLETENSTTKVIDFDIDNLSIALESNWEIR